MRRLYRIGSLLIACVLLVACGKTDTVGNGKVASELRKVSAFDRIDISGAYRLDVIGSGQPSVSVQSDSNILPLVVTQVKNRVLIIRNKPGVSFSVSKPVLVRVVVNGLKNIQASGANQIMASKIASDSFALTSSGAVQVMLSGKVGLLSLTMSGSSNILANHLVAKNVKIYLTGSGHVSINVTKKLDTHITGNGTIIYAGNPSTVNQMITGAGTIKRQGQ